MSASRIVDSAAEKFWVVVFTLLNAKSIRFCVAPIVDSAVLTVATAASMDARAVCAPLCVLRSSVAMFRPDAPVDRSIAVLSDTRSSLA